MSITTIVSFIKVTDSNGNVQDLYQNAKRDDFGALDNGSGSYVKNPNNYITFNGENYYYLPFVYQGAAKNRSGDNLEAQLVLANNALAMNRAREAVSNKWHIEVSVCVANPSTLSPERTLTIDNWLASSLSYDPTTVEVLLSSAIDAVGSNAPNRVLTTFMVGALPTSGQMQNR
tara:strand:- start:4682 stop:5203 length:522 start_codon:yes stop_codon:yes gene_type:complete